jgi:predicted nucleotidyltransferase
LIATHREQLLSSARRRGVPKSIFGLMTHDQAREDSDIELLMTLAPPQTPSEGAVIVRTAVVAAFSRPPSGLFCALLNI